MSGPPRFASALLLGALSLIARVSSADPDTEIVVLGQKSSRGARALTSASSRVDAADLQRPGASAAAILSHEAGVQVSATGAGSDLATASVRGASSAQTPVYLAGIRLNDDVSGTADLSLVPLWMLSRAEVYRGNAPADADRLGIGGAIYFEPRWARRTRVGAGGSVGSFGERSAWVGADIAHRDDGALVAFRGSGAKNDYPYLDDAGTVSTADDRTRERPNADYTAREAWAVGRTTVGKRGARVTTVMNAFEREQGVSGLAAIPALYARAESARVLAGLSAKMLCDADPNCEIELTSQALSARSRLSDPKRELGIGVSRVDTQGTRLGQSARLLLQSAGLRALFGANLERENLALDGGAAVRATRSLTSVRMALTTALGERGALEALAVVGCERTHGPGPPGSCADLAPKGRIGFRDTWGPFELQSNLGRYARVPTLAELYGISALVRGSSHLLPERALSSDLGLRWALGGGKLSTYFEAFGFARGVSQLIAYRRSSLGAVQPFNVGRARVVGAEFQAGFEWRKHLRTVLLLTLLDPRDTTPNRSFRNDLVPYQSRLVSNLYAEGFVVPDSNVVRRLGVDARLSYRASRLADPAGSIVLPGSSELDLGVSLLFASDLSLRGAIDDLFDARHFDFIGYPVPGRSLHTALEAWW